jgi:geranylgeranyl diphosphate synthase type I
LGTFGDPAATGKPALADLARGKRTALVAELGDDAEAEALLARATTGDRDAARALADRMESTGAKQRVEKRLDDLLAVARARLGSLAIEARAKQALACAIDALGERDR